MGIDGAGVGVHDPYQAYAVAEPHEGLVVDLAAGVAGGCDFHDQVGDDLRVSP